MSQKNTRRVLVPFSSTYRIMQLYVLWRVYCMFFPSGVFYGSTKPLGGVGVSSRGLRAITSDGGCISYGIPSGGICRARNPLQGVTSFFLHRIMQHYIVWRVYYTRFPSLGYFYGSTKLLEGVVFPSLEGYASLHPREGVFLRYSSWRILFHMKSHGGCWPPFPLQDYTVVVVCPLEGVFRMYCVPSGGIIAPSNPWRV